MENPARTISLEAVLEILMLPYAAGAHKGAAAGLPASSAQLARELLPRLIAILIVLLALSAPVLLILWRLHRPYS